MKIVSCPEVSKTKTDIKEKKNKIKTGVKEEIKDARKR